MDSPQNKKENYSPISKHMIKKLILSAAEKNYILKNNSKRADCLLQTLQQRRLWFCLMDYLDIIKTTPNVNH